MGGIDINLISANKQKSGNCGGGGSGMNGNSKWLGNLPGLRSFSNIFAQHASDDAHFYEAVDSFLSQVHDLPDEEIMSQLSALTGVHDLESKMTP